MRIVEKFTPSSAREVVEHRNEMRMGTIVSVSGIVGMMLRIPLRARLAWSFE